MSIMWADVSEWQTRVNDSYPYDVLAVRSNDGDYQDRNFGNNYAWGLNALVTGKLKCLIVYFVYRQNWQVTVDTHLKMVGAARDGVVSMIDIESWNGQIAGDQSDSINGMVDILTDHYTGNSNRVIAYGNVGDLDKLYPRPRIGMKYVIAAYGSQPKYGGMIAHQFTNGVVGGPVYISPFGFCDCNVAVSGNLQGFLDDVGITELPFTATGDDSMLPVEIYYYDDAFNPTPSGLNFRGIIPVEKANTSALIKEAVLRWVGCYGSVNWKIVAWSASAPIGEPDYTKDFWFLPDNSRMVTVEGTRANPGTIPAAALLTQPY